MIKLDTKEEINNPNNVKVVVDKNNKSLFFPEVLYHLIAAPMI
ncbi:MAG: hypothetical protein CM15mP102_20480 [Flavobacteriales bacterium]|nr:MAG: hypothetical protein CM15mP102_20480 [Flavobacteriales bacterium]